MFRLVPHAVCAGGDDAGHGHAARAGATRGRGTIRSGRAGRASTWWSGSGASTVTIVGRDGTRVHHPRKRFGQRSIDYRHYLAELARKPQAVRQVLPDLLRDLGAPFPMVWDQLYAAHGPREAARLFAKVLGQLDTPGRRHRRARLDRRARRPGRQCCCCSPSRRPVMSLDRLEPDAVPAPLRAIEVGSGCAADYDAWLVEVAGMSAGLILPHLVIAQTRALKLPGIARHL